jgi:hypothetical protein
MGKALVLATWLVVLVLAWPCTAVTFMVATLSTFATLIVIVA